MIDTHFLRLYSDVALPAGAAAACLLVAAFTVWAERRRMGRERLDAVGWVPWSALFFLALLCAVGLGLWAFRAWYAG